MLITYPCIASCLADTVPQHVMACLVSQSAHMQSSHDVVHSAERPVWCICAALVTCSCCLCRLSHQEKHHHPSPLVMTTRLGPSRGHMRRLAGPLTNKRPREENHNTRVGARDHSLQPMPGSTFKAADRHKGTALPYKQHTHKQHPQQARSATCLCCIM